MQFSTLPLSRRQLFGGAVAVAVVLVLAVRHFGGGSAAATPNYAPLPARAAKPAAAAKLVVVDVAGDVRQTLAMRTRCKIEAPEERPEQCDKNEEFSTRSSRKFSVLAPVQTNQPTNQPYRQMPCPTLHFQTRSHPG